MFATPLNGLDGFIKQELKRSMPRFDEYDDSSDRNHCDEAANTGCADGRLDDVQGGVGDVQGDVHDVQLSVDHAPQDAAQ